MLEVADSPGAQMPARRGRISPQARRHNEIRRAVLRAHPGVAELAGPNPLTALAIPVLLAIHWGIAWQVSASGILTVFLVAFFVGQLVIHAAGALLHETTHKLVFRGSAAKLAFDLGLEAVMASFSKQLTYQHEHLSSHHPYVGDYERDYEHEDICAYRARQLLIRDRPRLQRILTILTLVVHALPFGFLIGDYVFPPLYRYLSGQQATDARRNIGATRPPKWQIWTFIAVSALVNLFLLHAFGLMGWLYHSWSLSLFLGKLGISNLGQSLSEHDGDDEVNPTRSTYGWINWILFNTGYHNEHHTFANVAWTRLPELRRVAPEAFHHEAEKSYLGYWWEHVLTDFGPSRRNSLQ